MRKSTIALCVGVLGVAGIAAIPVWAASQNGRLMDITVNMHVSMPGMAMPPRTVHRQVCSAPGKFDPDAVTKMQSQSHCKVQNYHAASDTITFDLVCSGPPSITTHAEYHILGDSGFSGTAHGTMDMGGRNMTMETTTTGKQVGTCNYVPPASGS